MKKKICLLIILLAALIMPKTVQAEETVTLTVCQDGCDYKTITEAAQSRTTPQDASLTLELKEESYTGEHSDYMPPEYIVIDIPNYNDSYQNIWQSITIKGAGIDKTIINSYFFISNTPTITVENLTINQGAASFAEYTTLNLKNLKLNQVPYAEERVQNPGLYLYAYQPTTTINLDHLEVTNSTVDNLIHLLINKNSTKLIADFKNITTENTQYQQGIYFEYNHQPKLNITIDNADIAASKACSLVTAFYNEPQPASFSEQYGDNYIALKNSKISCITNASISTTPIYADKTNTWTVYPQKGKNIIEEGAKINYEIEQLKSITMKPEDRKKLTDIFTTYPDIIKKLAFHSSDDSIAEIKDGKIFSKKEGIATLTATDGDNIRFILKVEVIGNPVTASMQMMIIMLIVIVILATTLVIIYKKQKNKQQK